jgi:CheY-like chemotaxis protein
MRRLITTPRAWPTAVIECEWGDDAFAACAANRPDWLLKDIHLPEIDGITATARITAAFDAGWSRWPHTRSFTRGLAMDRRTSVRSCFSFGDTVTSCTRGRTSSVAASSPLA